MIDPELARIGRDVIARHSRSFSLASRLLPGDARDLAAVVYAWCRRADDAVDEAGGGDASLAVARLQGELDDIYAGAPLEDPIARGFAAAVSVARIPRRYPAELIAGMAMDATGHTYDGELDLLLYAYRVAGTVGLMMSHVMGLSDPAALRSAADLGIAMQLTNICRDVREDWDRGRLYLPGTRLAAAGVPDLGASLGRPLPVAARRPLSRVVAGLLETAAGYYASGARGLAALPRRCAFAVDAARRIYAAIGARVAASGHDVFAPRAVVPAREKARLVAAAAASAARHAPRRSRVVYRRDLPELSFEALVGGSAAREVEIG